jgi:hypothetical protein
MRTDPPSELPPLANRRPTGRKRAFLGCKIIYDEGRYSFPCTIRNISPSGARITFASGERMPSSFYLINERERTGHKARIIWASLAEAGVELESTFPLHAIPGELSFLKRFASRSAN